MSVLPYPDFLQTASEILHEQQSVAQRNALLVINLERLPELDGVLGYLTVDEIVQQVSEQLGNELNSKDIVGITGRYQIGCLLVDLSTNGHAMLAAHKVLRILTYPHILGERHIFLLPRIGVALSRQNSCDEIGELMSNASLAMHQAKTHKESIQLFAEEDDDLLLAGIDLWSDLGQAIEASELYLGYQPQINVSNGRIESTEALLRWNHPSRGPIRPDKMVGVAEGTELMFKLTMWVFHTALRQCAEYRKAGLDAGVSINFSADNIRDRELTELVLQGLNLWGVPPSCVTIELTETAVMENTPGSMETLHELKDIGLKLAMDDFGTGYSSMARLLELPLDEIKIDMIFVKNMMTQSTHKRIVDSMIGLGHRLNLSVVAEGVEDIATYECLRSMGCDIIQGYLIGQAIPVTELIETFANQPSGLFQEKSQVSW